MFKTVPCIAFYFLTIFFQLKKGGNIIKRKNINWFITQEILLSLPLVRAMKHDRVAIVQWYQTWPCANLDQTLCRSWQMKYVPFLPRCSSINAIVMSVWTVSQTISNKCQVVLAYGWSYMRDGHAGNHTTLPNHYIQMDIFGCIFWCTFLLVHSASQLCIFFTWKVSRQQFISYNMQKAKKLAKVYQLELNLT